MTCTVPSVVTARLITSRSIAAAVGMGPRSSTLSCCSPMMSVSKTMPISQPLIEARKVSAGNHSGWTESWYGRFANRSRLGPGHQLDDLTPRRVVLDLSGRDGGDTDDRLHVGQGAGLAQDAVGDDDQFVGSVPALDVQAGVGLGDPVELGLAQRICIAAPRAPSRPGSSCWWR